MGNHDCQDKVTELCRVDHREPLKVFEQDSNMISYPRDRRYPLDRSSTSNTLEIGRDGIKKLL